MTRTDRIIADAAYTHALQAANSSGEQPGLDGWWAVLRREEAAFIAAEQGATKENDAESRTTDDSGWAAYTSDYHGAKRWSRAHYFVGYARLPVCGRDPGPAVEWAAEQDTRSHGRGAHCVALLSTPASA